MRKLLSYIIFVFLLSLSYSCKYQKLLKSSDSKLKYEKANEYFDKKDYARAETLYEQLLSVFRGTAKGEEVAYKRAYCTYYNKDYIMAGARFRRFAMLYPNNEHAKESRFMSAYCYYLDAPKSSLDQEFTNKAIREFDLYVGKYPKDEKIEECNKIIDELRDKLEDKSYNNAILYYKMGHYLAATIALSNSLKDFPDSKHKEDIMFYIVKSHYKFAALSVYSKKRERLENALRAYKKFDRTFSDSKHSKELKRIHGNIKKALAEFG
ncbi:MAG: outer membrane protein assembly factor BamD [Draconibacterium sp.]|nr:MAG: outer membrane protein assembly factor BamD [Draconibacterium sp.]